jgi:hypothetical protein
MRLLSWPLFHITNSWHIATLLDFCPSILYPVTMLNSFIGSNSFLVSLWCFLFNIVPSEHSDSFASLFQFGCHFFVLSFAWWLGLTALCWKNDKSRCLSCFVLYLEKKLPAFPRSGNVCMGIETSQKNTRGQQVYERYPASLIFREMQIQT